MKSIRKNRKSGQAMVEYIIIVVVVAIAALAIVGVFSDTVRSKFGFATNELGGDSGAVSGALGTQSADVLKEGTAE